jgi:hypothetical protein
MSASKPAHEGIFPGNGEMSAAMRSYDWSSTPLGRSERWSSGLKTLVGVLLSSGQPMFLAWGAERTWFYNDAFVPILGIKHPSALGRRISLSATRRPVMSMATSPACSELASRQPRRSWPSVR